MADAERSKRLHDPPHQGVAERSARYIGDGASRALAWEGAAAAADAVTPGAGFAVRGLRELARLLKAAKSLNDGDGVDLQVPIVNDDLGFAAGVRIRLFETHPMPLPDISFYASVDRDYPHYRDFGSFEDAPPAARPAESTQRRETYHDPWQVTPDSDHAQGAGRRGVWWLGTPGHDARCVIVVVPHEELLKATGTSEFDAGSLVQYVEDHASVARQAASDIPLLDQADSSARKSEGSGPEPDDEDQSSGCAYAGPPSPRVIFYADPDTKVGLVVVNPVDGPAHAPLLLKIDDHSDAGPPFMVASPGVTRDEGNTGAEAARSGTGWPELLDELERFAGPAHLVVRTAIATYTAWPIVTRALDSLGPRSAAALNDLGAYAAGHLVNGLAHRGVDTDDQLAVRHALQEIIWHSLESVSNAALECRQHVAYLLASKPILTEILRDARADADLGDASRLRRVLKARPETDTQTETPDGTATDPDAPLEYVLEQLEYFADLANALDAVLTSLLKDFR